MTIGLTGGIGSGKSTVAIIFKALGIPVFNADKEAKDLYLDQEVKAQIVALFGNEIYTEEGLNRSKISDIVFSDPKKLRSLESILYPALDHKFSEWKEKNKNFPYKIKEAALLIEKKSFEDLDKIILVSAPRDVRIDRVMKRSSMTQDEVVKRINEQLSDDVKLNYSDYHIRNYGDHSTVKQVLEIHCDLMERVKAKLKN